jgi:hypothetical protein
MSQRTPPPPHTLPEQPEFHSKRYRRRKRPIIWQILVFALVLGIGGGLYYAWEVAPLEEFDTAPHQLREDDQQAYVVAIALNFSFDSDLASAIEHLLDVGLGDDPLQSVAGVACDLARTGYVDSSSGLRAVRALKTFYQLQGRTGCADVLIPDVEDPQVVEIDVPTPHTDATASTEQNTDGCGCHTHTIRYIHRSHHSTTSPIRRAYRRHIL